MLLNVEASHWPQIRRFSGTYVELNPVNSESRKEALTNVSLQISLVSFDQ